jgi:hypothetical protein
MRALVAGLLLLASPCLAPVAAFPSDIASPIARAGLIDRFDEMDRAVNKGEGYSNSTNESGALAWAESYLLEAYLDMYEATRNEKYLASFVRHADRMVLNTDRKRGVNDYKGRSVVGWSSTKYSTNQERIVWLVHTGMITYPLVRFARMAVQDNVSEYLPQARAYTSVAKSALAFFDRNWVYDSATGTGYYRFSADEPHSTNIPGPPMPLPFNQQLAAGRTIILLAILDGSDEYRGKAEALARHFRDHLKGSDGPYLWRYWYGKAPDRLNKAEDISHGAIDLGFAVLAYRSGIVFRREDIVRFADTYDKKIHKAGTVADRVDGSGEGRYKEATGRWLELSEFTCVPWRDFHGFLSRGEVGRHPEVMLGLAKLVKYFDRCASSRDNPS